MHRYSILLVLTFITAVFSQCGRNPKCGRTCYDPRWATCTTDIYTGSLVLCSPGQQSCNGRCFDPTVWTCQNGALTSNQAPQPAPPPPPPSAPVASSRAATSSSNVAAPATSAAAPTVCGAGLTACGPACYDASTNLYCCINGNLAAGSNPSCPAATSAAPATKASTVAVPATSSSTVAAPVTKASTVAPPATSSSTVAPPATSSSTVAAPATSSSTVAAPATSAAVDCQGMFANLVCRTTSENPSNVDSTGVTNSRNWLCGAYPQYCTDINSGGKYSTCNSVEQLSYAMNLYYAAVGPTQGASACNFGGIGTIASSTPASSTPASSTPAASTPVASATSSPVVNPTPSPYTQFPTQTADLRIINNCKSQLWFEARYGGAGAPLPGQSATSIQALPGSYVDYVIPDTGLSGTRFWAKYGCDNYGKNCLIGDQMQYYPNPPGGCPPGGCTPPVDSLFEATWGCRPGSSCNSQNPTTWFDTSQVDGWTIPYKLTPVGDTSGCDCNGPNCGFKGVDASTLDVTKCPSGEDLTANGNFTSVNVLGTTVGLKSVDLRIINNGQILGCMSPCKRLNWGVPYGLQQPEDTGSTMWMCCPTPTPNDCSPSNGCISPQTCRAGPIENTQYVAAVHSMAPGVYAYSYDDGVGLHACPAGVTKYTMEFCPSGSAAYPGTV